MTGTELTLSDRRALAIQEEQIIWSPTQLAALEQIGVKDANDADLMVFFDHAKRTRLDPFLKQIYMIERTVSGGGKRQTIQVGIDGFRIVANRTGHYGGKVSMEWADANGRWYDMWPFELPPVAARVYVRRIGWPDLTIGVAMYREFAATYKDGNPLPMWHKMPANQLAKCAEAAALRAAFPNDLSGLYVPEEMEQADNPEPGPIIDGGNGSPAGRQGPGAKVPDWSKMIAERVAVADQDIEAALGGLQALLTQAKGMTRDPAVLNAILDAQRSVKARRDAQGSGGDAAAGSGRSDARKAAPRGNARPPADEPEPSAKPGSATGPQKAKIARLIRGSGIEGEADQHFVVARIANIETWPLVSYNDLSEAQAAKVEATLDEENSNGTIDVFVGKLGPAADKADEIRDLWTKAREKKTADEKAAKAAAKNTPKEGA